MELANIIMLRCVRFSHMACFISLFFYVYFTAMVSISIITPKGKSFTAKAARAG